MPRIGERGWIHSGVKVYDNTNSPTSWTDLDLSAVVGKNRAFVLIKILNRNAALDNYCYTRMNGETNEVAKDATLGCMLNGVVLAPTNIAYFVIETDKNGIFEWKAVANRKTDIWVLGYIL